MKLVRYGCGCIGTVREDGHPAVMLWDCAAEHDGHGVYTHRVPLNASSWTTVSLEERAKILDRLQVLVERGRSLESLAAILKGVMDT